MKNNLTVAGHAVQGEDGYPVIAGKPRTSAMDAQPFHLLITG